MRKFCLLLGMLVLLGGCSSVNDSGPEIKREVIPDPLVEVEGTQAFARVGADIECPLLRYLRADCRDTVQSEWRGVLLPGIAG